MKRTQDNITVNDRGDFFRIDTKNTSYMIGVRDGLYLGHFYYGPRISDDDLSYRTAFAPEGRISRTDREMVIFMDGFRFEYPGWGAGDSREGALKVLFSNGTTRVCPTFLGYEISSSKAPVPGLPSTYAAEGEADTLRI